MATDDAARSWGLFLSDDRGWHALRLGWARWLFMVSPHAEAAFARPKEREQAMNEAEFQAKLGELIKQIGDLPEGDRDRLEKLAGETRDRHEKMRTTIAGLQESLDYLRLSVKYLVFDLEATRRENQYLRKMLERQGPRNQEQSEEE